jgi:hypothetical protein
MRALNLALCLACAPPAPAAAPLLALAGVELLLPHLARPAPFPRQWALARAMAAGDAEWQARLAPLAAAAAQGAPSRRQVQDSFGAAATDAGLAEMDGQGRLARLPAATMRLGARHAGRDMPVLAATALAGIRLAGGHLQGADHALDGLAAPPAEALARWRRSLARRLAADAAARDLEALPLRRTP